MITRRITLASLLSSLMLAIGCYGSDGAGSASIPLEEFPGMASQSFCRLLEPCCSDRATFDDQRCTGLLSNGLFRLDAADPDKYSYDASAAGACLEALEGFGSLCNAADQVALDTMPDACGATFRGTVPPGGTCNASIECTRPAGADVDCDEGTCIVERTASEGDACYWTCTRDGPTYNCSTQGGVGPEPVERGRCYTNDGLYCARSGVCTRRGGAGERCDDFLDGCEDGLHCDIGTSTCTPVVAAGEPCAGMDCEEHHYCNASGVCEPLVPCSQLEDTSTAGSGATPVCTQETLGGPGGLFCIAGGS